MDNTLKRAIELCLAVYRITDKFPRGEVLSPKLRGLAIDIAECLIYNKALPTNSGRVFNLEDLTNKIRVLFLHFGIAKMQGWVDARNFEVLREAYRGLYRSANNVTGSDSVTLKSDGDSLPRPTAARTRYQLRMSLRQEKILDFLRANEGGQAISDVARQIKASNKTAERELKKLIKMGRARKRGKTRGARFLIAG